MWRNNDSTTGDNEKRKKDRFITSVIEKLNIEHEDSSRMKRDIASSRFRIRKGWFRWIFCDGCTNIRSQWLTFLDERKKLRSCSFWRERRTVCSYSFETQWTAQKLKVKNKLILHSHVDINTFSMKTSFRMNQIDHNLSFNDKLFHV